MLQVLKVFVFVSALFGLSAQAQAARVTGNYLLEMCASNDDGKELIAGAHGVCQSYIAAIIDYHNLVRSLGNVPAAGLDFCIPEKTTMNELQRVVALYLRRTKHQNGSFVAAPAVVLALYGTYPCRKK